MSDPVAIWVEKLAAKPLPALQESIHQVRLMLDSPSVNHVRLSNFIEFDPGFCVHVFRAMNRLPKRPKETITKLSNALPMLGMERMSNATRELQAVESVLKKRPLDGLINCFSRAAHAAIYAQTLAQHRDVEALTEYAVAALLHDIGEMALWVQNPDLMETINLRTVRGEPRDEVAREILGCTIEQISAGISRTWELPALTIEAQDISNSYREAPLTVMLAAALARSTASGWNTQTAHDHIELFGEFLDRENDTATGYFHALAADAARRLTGRGFVLPAFGLIQQGPVILPQTPPLVSKTRQRSATPEEQVKAQPAPEPNTIPRPTTSPNPVKAEAAPAPEPETLVRSATSANRVEAEPAPAPDADPRPRPSADQTKAPLAQRPAPPPRPAVAGHSKSASEALAAPPIQKSAASESLAEPRAEARESMSNERPTRRPVSERPGASTNPTAQVQPSALQQQPRPSPAGPQNTTTKQPAAGAKRSSALETISGTLREMLGQEQIQRLMFAVLTPDRKGLKCGLAMNVPTHPSLKGFSLGFERANLFSALLKKPQIFWLNHENKTKYLPTIPNQARSMLGEDGFLLMSIFVKDRPVGVLYADSGNPDAPLTSESYNLFKTSCQHLVKTLNQTI